MSVELSAGHDWIVTVEQLAGPGPAREPASTARASTARASVAMVRGRTCYDHLAGRLGVGITDSLAGAGLIDQRSGLVLTTAGLAWLADRLDVDVTMLTAARRPVARSCLDWTERRPHLAGGAGAALCAEFFRRGWIVRARQHPRCRGDPVRRGRPAPALRDLHRRHRLVPPAAPGLAARVCEAASHIGPGSNMTTEHQQGAPSPRRCRDHRSQPEDWPPS